MAVRRNQQMEVPPQDWTPTQAVANPIINNPFGEPSQYWLYREGIPNLIPGRRPASYWYKTRRVGTQDELFREENQDDLPLVNALREDVKRWRESGYRGVASVTRELFAWWARSDRPRRLFFCQQEAVETIVYLLEVALPGRLRTTGFQKFALDGRNIDLLLSGQKPDFKQIAGDFFPKLVDTPADPALLPLRRIGCKMATGAGKTIVMAMLIAWAFCNRMRNPSSTHFPNAILICAPNLTVKKRLQVLRPEDPDNYYNLFDLVPSKYREYLNMGRVLITNWHALALKSEKSEGDKTYAVVNKGEETNDAFTLDRLGALAHRLPILVLNDEGHHCWRGRALTKEEEQQILNEKTKEEKEVLLEEAEEARIWLAGLDRINNCGLLGKDENAKLRRGIIACVDLSATPFYLATSGYPEGSPFPWLVSDFGLVDAIESGLVKVPRLPVRDDLEKKDEIGRPDPAYFRLWERIKQQLEPRDYIRKSQPKPEAVYRYAEGALVTLAAQWKVQFEKYREEAAGNPFIPPVLIVVCDNTELSKVFYQKISGETDVETMDESGKTITVKAYGGGIFAEFSNSEQFRHTIRIDSKLLKQIETEEGESKDEAALRLREVIDTIGKPGGTGEHVRCIVSVSMLTEGWDANNVTHILGVRAFESQLLCEQVVGRGLRRRSYFPDPQSGMLQAEYVDVYGIPFSLIPYKGKPKDEKDKPDPVYHNIYAVPERADKFEIRVPNVESYVYALREGGITCDVDKLEGFIVDGEPGKVYLRATRGYVDEANGHRDAGDFTEATREEYYESIRLQQLYFRFAQLILEDLLKGAQSSETDRGKIKFLARHQLFPEIVRLVQSYVEKKVIVRAGVDRRELGLERYATLLCQRLRDGILPASYHNDAKLLPVLNSFRPYSTTADVNYPTTRPVVDLARSHLNKAAMDSTWERGAIRILEDTDLVECFTPNDRQIGLWIPYEYGEHSYSFEPDFMVRLRNGVMLMLEIKGIAGSIHAPDRVLAKNAAARKWVSAVNNLGKYGRWEFEICEDLNQLSAILKRHGGTAVDGRPFRFVMPTPETAWTTCVPLTSLKAAASKFSEEQMNLEQPGESSQEWITWDAAPRFEKGMFVARIHGKSMEPDIPDGSYCLFRQPRAGTRQGKTVLVWHSGVSDPNTGGQYTVKVYESEKRGTEEGEWTHTRIILKPHNPEFQPIILEPQEEGEVRVIAEFVQALPAS